MSGGGRSGDPAASPSAAVVIRWLVCGLLAVCGGMLITSYPSRSRPSQAGVLLLTFAAVSAVFARW